MLKKTWSIFFVLLFCQSLAQAAIRIKIDQGNVRAIPVAVVPFKMTNGAPVAHDIAAVVRNDLSVSGRFDPIDPNSFVSFPASNDEVRFKDWRYVNAEVLVIGRILPNAASSAYDVEFRVYDVAREQQLGGFRFQASEQQFRNIAHEVSDFVYKAVTNRPGAFSSRLAFVRKVKLSNTQNSYRLVVSDWDGYGQKDVFISSKPILSPSWSPDSKKIAFVSFSNKGPAVQVLDLNTGGTEVIAAFRGVNGAPAWSPDGMRLAYSSSKTGSADVYVYDFRTKNHQRMTTHYGIDTEPAWSSDGRELLFTSSRTGKPQIYKKNLFSQEVVRVTFEGKENANASYDYSGRKMAMVHEGGQIVVMDIASGRLNWITNAKFDESPTFSHNGDMLIYTTEQNYRPALVVASTDGRVRTKLNLILGDVREPAWSSLIK